MCLYIFPNLLQGEMYLPKHNNLFHFYFDNFLQIAQNADAADSCLTCKLMSQSMGNISNPFLSTAKPRENLCLQNFQLTSPLQVVKVETNRKGQRAMVVAIHFD